ncbi:Predicted dehydrogenase [Arboricoccus pini]|uniref:Predicted dehydrogenase n=1 Tax=Arboricoccus pini TaxID=1963835 RepID=A0A212RZ01_9PROT|nr:Gfo/Idh/MocA family oxidoreductase [Arboricoccus pini]SNB77898.1 Predicted dehydrogenase [Arboricoccus pini]
MAEAARPLKVAVAGFGMAGSCHAEAWRDLDGVELVATYSDCLERDEDAIRAACGPDIRIFADYDRFLGESGADIVSVATLPDRHCEHIVKAARSGSHVVAEKPICTTAEDLEAIREAVEQAGVRFTACFQEFHYGQFLAAIDMIEQGMLGRVHLAEVEYYNGMGPWVQQYWWTRTARHGVSSMVNCGCHGMMLAMLLMGDELPEEVMAMEARSAAADFAAFEFAPTQINLLRFAGGRIAKVSSCLDAIQPYAFTFKAVGAEGSLDQERFTSRRIAGLERTLWSTLGARGLGDATVIGGHMYLDFFKLFLASIATGKDLPRTGLAPAYRMHKTLFAADEAARIGRPVKLAKS